MGGTEFISLHQARFVELIADVIKRLLHLVPCPVKVPDGTAAPFGQNLPYDLRAGA